MSLKSQNISKSDNSTHFHQFLSYFLSLKTKSSNFLGQKLKIAWTLLFIFIIPGYWKPKIIKIGLHKVGIHYSWVNYLMEDLGQVGFYIIIAGVGLSVCLSVRCPSVRLSERPYLPYFSSYIKTEYIFGILITSGSWQNCKKYRKLSNKKVRSLVGVDLAVCLPVRCLSVRLSKRPSLPYFSSYIKTEYIFGILITSGSWQNCKKYRKLSNKKFRSLVGVDLSVRLSICQSYLSLTSTLPKLYLNPTSILPQPCLNLTSALPYPYHTSH